MKNAVFFDIDGTLWDYYHSIPETTVRAVKELQKNGGLAFINTGRTLSTIQEPELLEIGFDGIIGGCGTYIEYRGKELQNILIPYDMLIKTRGIMKREHFWAFYEGVEDLYIDTEAFGDDPYAVSFQEKLGPHCKDDSELSPSSRINKFSIDYRESTADRVKASLGTMYDLIIHEFPGTHVSEIMPKGCSKGTAIKTICEKLDIDIKDTYAFGDSANDMGMLKSAGHGIAMGNGVDMVKNAAEYITTPIDQDGIMNGLKHYGLI
jgi:Cof subfamily protein (haloacid dehalogenase superfamily)